MHDNMKPRIFTASSKEGLDISYAIQENLEYDADVTVWTQGIFKPSDTNLDSILDQLNQSDYGIFVFTPDDIVSIRGDEHPSIRDNVLFELGIFIGRMGVNRCFIVSPSPPSEFRVPSDLEGVNILVYNPNRTDDNLNAALGPGCNRVRNIISSFDITKRVHNDLSSSKYESHVPLGQSIRNVFQELHDLHNSDQWTIHGGIATGFGGLDSSIGGLQNGSLVVLMGNQGAGKTTFCLNLAVKSLGHDESVGPFQFVTLQNTVAQCTRAIMVSESRIAHKYAITGTLEEKHWPRLARAAGRLSTLGLYIDDDHDMTLNAFVDLVSHARANYDISCVFLDSVQDLADFESNPSMALTKIKKAAAKNEIPIVVTLTPTLLTRGVLSDPGMVSIANGELPREVDVALLLHRPETIGITVDEEGNSTEGLAELHIARNRFGPSGRIDFAFHRDYCRFEELEASELEQREAMRRELEQRELAQDELERQELYKAALAEVESPLLDQDNNNVIIVDGKYYYKLDNVNDYVQFSLPNKTVNDDDDLSDHEKDDVSVTNE